MKEFLEPTCDILNFTDIVTNDDDIIDENTGTSVPGGEGGWDF